LLILDTPDQIGDEVILELVCDEGKIRILRLSLITDRLWLVCPEEHIEEKEWIFRTLSENELLIEDIRVCFQKKCCSLLEIFFEVFRVEHIF